MAATKRAKKSETELDFETALTRLEKIVQEMEEGQHLEQMMTFFEEGTGLVKICTRKLNEIEKKIEKLVEKGDGTETEPFPDRPEGP